MRLKSSPSAGVENMRKLKCGSLRHLKNRNVGEVGYILCSICHYQKPFHIVFCILLRDTNIPACFLWSIFVVCLMSVKWHRVKKLGRSLRKLPLTFHYET